MNDYDSSFFEPPRLRPASNSTSRMSPVCAAPPHTAMTHTPLRLIASLNGHHAKSLDQDTVFPKTMTNISDQNSERSTVYQRDPKQHPNMTKYLLALTAVQTAASRSRRKGVSRWGAGAEPAQGAPGRILLPAVGGEDHRHG